MHQEQAEVGLFPTDDPLHSLTDNFTIHVGEKNLGINRPESTFSEKVFLMVSLTIVFVPTVAGESTLTVSAA